MKNKRKKWMHHIIAFVLVIAMLLPLATPVSAQAAENDLYLAYQNTETGKTVVKLKGASAKAVYKVTELNMSKGDSVDLCFINASLSWHNAKWTSDNKKVATVNGDGVITAIGEGVAKITLTYDVGWGSKKQESATVTVYVGKDNWKLHIGTTANDIPESRELKVGRNLDLAFWGVSDWNSGKLFEIEWMTSDEKVLSVDKSTGIITALKPGTAKVAIHLFNKVSNITINDTIEVKVLPMAFSESTWQNENYLTYGENYFRLFSGDYMFRIPGSILDKHVLKEYGRIAETPSGGAITENYYNAVSKLNDLDKFLMGAFEFLQNGTSATVNAFLGGEDTYEEGKAYACILRFVEELHKNENSINSIVSDAAGTTDILNSIYSEAVDLSKSEMIEILGDSKYLTETEIKEMVNELYANYDLIGDLVSEGASITEYIGSTMRLYEVDEAVIYLLSQCTSNGSSLSNALNVLYKERSKNGVAACTEKYLSDKAADVINGIINEGTGGASNAIIKAAGKVEEILHLDMDSYYAAVEYSCYQAELRNYCKGLLKEINANFNSYTEEELKDKIEVYEFAYEAYITASRMMLEEALKIAKSAEKDKVQASLNALNAFDYNSAVDLAMKYFKMDNPKADEHEKVFAVRDNSSEQTTGKSEKKQYGYYHYTDGNGDYAVCAYYGQETDGWKNIYREEIWVDEPLKLVSKSATSYKHPEVSGCKTAGCLDGDFWTAGGKFVDENGVSWYREQTRIVSNEVNETQTRIVIKETSQVLGKEDVTDAVLQARMEELVDKLLRANREAPKNDNATEAYFTTTGKEYNADSGDTCKNTKVVKETWFTDVFGNVNVDNFPKHLQSKGNGDSNIGYSCFGFACFAQWYIYKNSNNDKVTAKQIATGEYTKEFLTNNLQTGDIIRIYISKNGSKYYHSMVFHSFTENGMIVLDCNRNTDNKVRLNEIKYSRDGWNGDPVWIYRVQE